MGDTTAIKVIRTCCDTLGLILKVSVIYANNDHFCSIVIDGVFISATNGCNLIETINANCVKALRRILGDNIKDHYDDGSQPSTDYIDFNVELYRVLPIFEEFMTNFRRSNEKTKEDSIPRSDSYVMKINPFREDSKCFSIKNYTTTTAVDNRVAVQIEQPPPPVKVVKRVMLYPDIRNANSSIDEGNIGFKMLIGLGWSGGPLGNKQDGIVEPISLESHTNRKGLGCKQNTAINPSMGFITASHFFDYLRHYANDPQQIEDLEFSEDFTRKEKKKLFGISKQLNLLSFSEHRNGIPVVRVTKKAKPTQIIM